MAQGDDGKDPREGEGDLPDFIDTGDDDATSAAADGGSGEASELVPESEPIVTDVADEIPDASAGAAPAPEAPKSGKGKGKGKPAASKAAAPVAAAAATRAPAPEGESFDPTIHVRPHAEGIFETEPQPLDPVRVAELDESVSARRRSMLAIGIIAGTVVVTAIFAIWLMSQEERREEVQAFLSGTVVEHKTAEVRRLKEQWSDEDRRARNRYGEVTLTFFPGDARVRVVQTKLQQSGAAWRRKEANLEKVGETEIANDTANLKPGQTIESLPLINLPIFEASKGPDGSVEQVNYYEYRVQFEREGYYPQEKVWRADDWSRVGPGNEVINWPGLDLVPKPETQKANFSKAMHAIFCMMKQKNLATIQDASTQDNFEIILLRNGFKTKEDFQKASEVLTSGEFAEWWKTEQESIAKQACEEPGAAPKK
ncbi:MAG: hypothetical protein H6744_15325 [Deltaproteobacteria bacterium]|nr:hypothetical protein [Deltaproteobacteria bacterium]MCB9788053.1 hypothetical protein [Deltaproteobacteria bacterium]